MSNKRIYLDNAATTRVDDDILNEITKYFNVEYANPSSIYKESRTIQNAIYKARSSIAKLINASDDEIYFTSGGTESDNWAIQCVQNENKKHIITSKIEHHAILNTCKYMKESGLNITYLDVDKSGFINPQTLEENITKDNTSIVSIMTANNEIGTIQPIKQLCKIAHQNGAYFHTDAVQAVGKLNIDVKDTNVDMMSISGHKIHALKGIGALYIKKSTHLKNLIYGGSQENYKRAGTENVPAIVSLGLACEKLISNNKEQNYIRNLRDYFIYEVLFKIDDCILTGNSDSRLINNASFCFADIDSKILIILLDKAGICASVGSACTSGSVENSHVLQAIGVDDKYINGNIRFTLSKYNTKEEIDYVVSNLAETVKKLRNN
ncbi:MAG: cysteine desulfurase family protein [Peptoanaerobacter stomatis]|uniref:cysteine desulfurase family protein n=1 Tax=Peptoanaerobacter stomatis TaxID=796937 RepID=UPI003FA05EB4